LLKGLEAAVWNPGNPGDDVDNGNNFSWPSALSVII